MNAWFVIGAVALGSYVLRAVMLVLVSRKPLPPRVVKLMGLVGPAAAGGLVATLALTSSGSVAQPSAAVVVALLAAYLVTRRTGKVVHAVAVGFPVLWVLTALGW